MAVAYFTSKAGSLIVTCLSGDTKPASPQAGWINFETDTGIINYVSGGVWTPVSAGAVAWDDVTGKPASLTSIAGLTTAADKMIYTTASNTYAVTDLTSFARTILDDANAGAVRTTIGSTTVGDNLFTLTNPSAITFLRVNADNTVTARSASDFRSDIGAGTGSGDALVANPLSQFAATTSTQLRGVLSDEIGTGFFVTAPTIVGQSLKVLRVNAGETDLEWITPSGSGDMLLGTIQTVTAAKTFNTNTLVLAGSTSGTTILNATAIAGAGTVVLPTTGTLATLAGTEALTNKTYNGNTWTAGSATLTLAGNLITSGAFNTTFTQQTSTNITIPNTSGVGSFVMAGSTAAFTTGRIPYTITSGSGVMLTDSANGLFNGTTMILGGGSTVALLGEILSVQKNQNAVTNILASNSTSGAAARSAVQAYVGAGGIGHGVGIQAFSAGYTSAAMTVAGHSALLSTGGDLDVGTNSTHILAFWSAQTGRANFGTAGRFYIGDATTAATARLHIAAGSDVASGAPFKLTTGALTTGGNISAGSFEYLTPQLFFTNGGAQRQEIPLIQQSRVSTQFDKTDTTLAAITGLTATLVAGKIYKFVANLFVDASVVGGSKYSMSGTATATAIIYETILTDNTTNASTITSRQTTLNTTGVGQAGTTVGFCKVIGLITCNAAGTITPMFSQNAANGTSSILIGSNFVIQEMI